MDNLRKWALTSLTIGPQSNETNFGFWREAFNDLPPLPGVEKATIIYNYPMVKTFNTHCWVYFDNLLTCQDLFPALKVVYVHASCRWQPLDRNVFHRFRKVRRRGLGPRKLLAFWQDHRVDTSYETQGVIRQVTNDIGRKEGGKCDHSERNPQLIDASERLDMKDALFQLYLVLERKTVGLAADLGLHSFKRANFR